MRVASVAAWLGLPAPWASPATTDEHVRHSAEVERHRGASIPAVAEEHVRRAAGSPRDRGCRAPGRGAEEHVRRAAEVARHRQAVGPTGVAQVAGVEAQLAGVAQVTGVEAQLGSSASIPAVTLDLGSASGRPRRAGDVRRPHGPRGGATSAARRTCSSARRPRGGARCLLLTSR